PPSTNHRPEVPGGVLDVAALSDVVDSALHDQDVRTLRALVEPRCDLVGALAVDAAVAELELRIGARGPVVPAGRPGRARGDRIAERGDDDARASPLSDRSAPRC